MTLKLQQLKDMWEKEKECYLKLEVGSGCQKFVKEILKSNDFFHLRKGDISTKKELRKHEFLEEVPLKGKIADVVIYINSEQVIPVEIERYQNIDAGTKQIFEYQLLWDKSYGILTDGFTWRFYNNNAYIELTLDQMFNDTNLFSVFWNNYIRPDEYYISFLEPKNRTSLAKKHDNLTVDKHKELFFEDITKLIENFRIKLKVSGYFDNTNTEAEKEKKAIEITYAYIIQFILYKVLVDNEFNGFEQDFNKRLETICTRLKHQAYLEILIKIQGISKKISKDIYRPFSEEQKYIEKTLKDIYDKPENMLSDVTPWLDILIFIKKYNFSNIQSDIFGYVYENYLKCLYEEDNLGQYFTDPCIASFMLDLVGFTHETIESKVGLCSDNPGLSIIDPSCGSGTFLCKVVERIVNSIRHDSISSYGSVEELISRNVFGLDISEFPLYLAEMNIVMRLLPNIIGWHNNHPLEKKIKVFKTKDSIAEFMDTPLYSAKTFDTNSSLFGEHLNLGHESYIRDEMELISMKRSLQSNGSIPRIRFDYVIGNPPYISYNQCSKQGLLTFQLIKNKKVKLNNIYGMNLHSVPGKPKKHRPNPNLYIFFIALGIALLKDGGKLCYIIPMSLLVNSDFDVVRFHLAKYTTIETILTFNHKMFIKRGLKGNKEIPTSSMILVISRKVPKENQKVKIINYIGEQRCIEDTIELITKEKDILKKDLLQSELATNLNNWLLLIRANKNVIGLIKDYDGLDSLETYSNHVVAKHFFGSEFYFDGGPDIDEKKVLSFPMDGCINYRFPILDNHLWSIKSFKGFWPNIRDDEKNVNYIKLRQGNQGYYFLDQKYKIIWSYNKTERFFFTDKPVIWARNKNNGIGSNNKNELLYLFALLNSNVTKFILKEKIKLNNEERRTMLLGTTTLKSQLRIPKITDKNLLLKNLLIEGAEELIKLESLKLNDLVNFSNALIQNIDSVSIQGDNVLLKRKETSIHCRITKNKPIVERMLNKIDYPIKTSELKNLHVLNYERQQKIKENMNNITFALYFCNQLDNCDFQDSEQLRALCETHPYYNTLKEYE